MTTSNSGAAAAIGTGSSGADHALYLYGFVPDGTPSPPAGVTGVAERPVEVLELGYCGAALSRVPAETYAADVVEARLEDLEWVARHGLAHERVVSWFVDHAWILPARLLTLYSSAETLRDEADSRRDEVAGALDRMEGLYEWDLKVSYRADRLEEKLGELSDEVADLEEEIAASSPGRGYLLERVKEEKSRDRAAQVALRVAEDLLDALRRHAEDSVRLDLPRDDDELPVVLGAALLARPPDEERLRDVVRERSERLEGKGVEIAFSGPWAPYRFLADEAPADVGRDRAGRTPRG